MAGQKNENSTHHRCCPDWCKKWTENDPEDSFAWTGLGIAYCELKRYVDAIKAYRQALRIDPGNAYVWGSLGFVYIDLNLYDDAIEAFGQAAHINPDDETAWTSLSNAYGLRAIAYMEAGRCIDAVEACRHALRINPNNATSLWGLGMAYLCSSNKTAALDVVKELQRLDAERADRLYNLIMLKP